ncbi:hypothetical protein [Collinsella tanakaei]|uniref:hypothetical protein n=1 Tax=Collinsella tanakaei TaxID=626935 RepID=UPI00195C74A1|nr:hypothetical protein [Collinsella tanakaei]MBM6868303.1 hypothetical protein [Collinsella tanakaei]
MYIALAVMLAAACIAVGCFVHRRAARKAASASQGSASPTSPAAERKTGRQPDGKGTSSGEGGPDDDGQDPA